LKNPPRIALSDRTPTGQDRQRDAANQAGAAGASRYFVAQKFPGTRENHAGRGGGQGARPETIPPLAGRARRRACGGRDIRHCQHHYNHSMLDEEGAMVAGEESTPEHRPFPDSDAVAAHPGDMETSAPDALQDTARKAGPADTGGTALEQKIRRRGGRNQSQHRPGGDARARHRPPVPLRRGAGDRLRHCPGSGAPRPGIVLRHHPRRCAGDRLGIALAPASGAAFGEVLAIGSGIALAAAHRLGEVLPLPSVGVARCASATTWLSTAAAVA